MDIIKSRGFIAETYSLRPQTGFVMNVYRIVNPMANPHTLNRYPVLYGHGVLFDSHTMVAPSTHSRPRRPVLGQPTILYGDREGYNDYSLPFMLSNNNFDVWLYDSRAVNDYGRNLTADLDPLKAQTFWDFSLDDEALIDLPILIDFVLTKTASPKLVYVGYSESTFFMFALMSRRPDYAARVAAFVALAPVAYVSHLRGVTVPIVVAMEQLLPGGLNTNFIPQPITDVVNMALRNGCRIKGIKDIFCRMLYNSIGGAGSSELSPEFFDNYFKSTSWKSMKHFAQLFQSKRFAMFDYGVATNMKIYGQPLSPSYELRNIKSDRIILIRGQNDILSAPDDQIRIIRELGTRPYLDISVPGYNHFDFINGKNLIQAVNAPAVLGIYQLLYKDGPYILRTPEQMAAIIANDQLGRGGTKHIERNEESQMKASKSLDIEGMLQILDGGAGLRNQLKLLSNIF